MFTVFGNGIKGLLQQILDAFEAAGSHALCNQSLELGFLNFNVHGGHFLSLEVWKARLWFVNEADLYSTRPTGLWQLRLYPKSP